MLDAWEEFIGDRDFGELPCHFHDIFQVMRAMENQVFVISANQVGQVEGQGKYCGRGNIIHPIGRILASTGSEGENLVYSDIDVNQDIAEAKAVVLQEWHKERRPSVYRHLSSKLVDVQE